MSGTEWMIYGASGYTGKLIARLAKERGLTPVLAGRSASSIDPLAKELGFSVRIFDLADPAEVERNLKGMKVILHCAGPFSKTYRAMAEGCLAVGAHYLDITGEIPVFEGLHHLSERAKKAKVALIPGVGFDVVPSDALAAFLKDSLPDATSLELAFAPQGGVSPGTLKTMVEGLPFGGCVRREGKLIPAPMFSPAKTIKFSGGREILTACIPWGDVSTAYFTTGIPNITTFAATPRPALFIGRTIRPFKHLLALPSVQNFLKGQVTKRVKGPSEGVREKGKVFLWGRVENEKGESKEAHLDTCEGYRFTSLSAMAAVQILLKNETLSGFFTPTQAFGPEFLNNIPGQSAPRLIS